MCARKKRNHTELRADPHGNWEISALEIKTYYRNIQILIYFSIGQGFFPLCNSGQNWREGGREEGNEKVKENVADSHQ